MDSSGGVRGERGEGRLQLLIWLAILGAIIFAAFRIVPVKIRAEEFNAFADEQIKIAAAASGAPREEKLMRSIFDKARDLEIPLDKKNVRLTVQTNEVRLAIKYRVVIKLEVYDWVWDYDKVYTHMRF